MTNYLEIMSTWMNQPHYVLIVLIVLYFSSATVDFVIGTFNAAYTKGVQYSSRLAQIGILRKLVTLMLMIMVVPLALMLPFDIGVYSLIILYVGIVTSEIYSILAHVGIVKDGDKHKNLVGTLFTQLLNNVTQTVNKNK